MTRLWENFFALRHKQKDQIETILAGIPVFQDLNHRELRTIKRILHQREYRSDEVIFNEGDIGLGMYIIEKGNVFITCRGDGHILAELKEGDFFGELALLDESPRSASAVARTPTRMLCFFKPALLDLIERSPTLGSKILFKLAWTIGERLKSMNEQIKELRSGVKQDNKMKEEKD
jgi:CRP/FNR family transcriptional regulator, cyclic AMP receptor protein